MNYKLNFNDENLLRITEYDGELWIIPSISSYDSPQTPELIRTLVIAARNTASLFHQHVNICMDPSKVFTVHFMKHLSTKYQVIIDLWKQIVKELIPFECFFDMNFRIAPSSLILSKSFIEGVFIDIFDVLKVKISQNKQNGIIYFLPDPQSINFTPLSHEVINFPAPLFNLLMINPPKSFENRKHLLDSFHVHIFSDQIQSKLFESQIFPKKQAPRDSYVLDSPTMTELISVLLDKSAHLNTATRRIDAFLGVKVYHPGSILNFPNNQILEKALQEWKSHEFDAPSINEFQALIASGKISEEWNSLTIYSQIQDFIKKQEIMCIPKISFKKNTPLISVILSAALCSHIYRVIYIPWKGPFESLSRFLVEFGAESFLIVDTDFNDNEAVIPIPGLHGVMIRSSEDGQDLSDCCLNFVYPK